MKTNKILLISALALFAFVCPNVEASNASAPKSEKAEKAPKAAKAEKAEKASKEKKEVTIMDIIAAWENPAHSGDADVDRFFDSTNEILLSYKAMNEEINFVRIETREIPDAGDGVTSEVLITDGDGNPRTKEATAERWTAIGLLLGNTVLEVADAVTSGTAIVQGISSDPSKAMAMGKSVKQMKTCIKALELLGKELPITVQLIDTQVKAMKQVKAN